LASVWQVGDRIENRWEILEVRSGGMGVVYIVRDQECGVKLAAKTFKDSVFAADPKLAKRFEHEARIWIDLDSHPNITQAVLVKEIHGRPLILLEFVATDLAEWVASGSVREDLAQILQFAINFCDGMTYAYSKGVRAHRDLKPANCLITSGRVLKITDFGLASVWDVIRSTAPEPRDGAPGHGAGNASTQLTPAGAGLGTPAYMAPEQFFEARSVDARADVYAFGVTLYELLTGRLPFYGTTNIEWAALHCGEAVPQLPSGLPVELDGVVQRCMSKKPSDRFPDFESVRAVLSELHEKLMGTAAPTAPVAGSMDSAQWRRKGIGLADLGRLEESLVCFAESLECDPFDSATWQCKAVALSRLGRRKESLECIERAIKIDPDSAKAWGSKAVHQLEDGNLEESLDSANRAISLDSGDWALWQIKAAVLNRSRKHNEALEVADKTLRIYPKADIAWTEKGRALRGLDRVDEACRCLDRAIEINKNSDVALGEKADILIGLGRYTDAIPLLDRALLLNPDAWSFWWDKGVALGAIKAPAEQELECFSRCVALVPNLPNGWYSKGVALHDLGNLREALECYDRALTLKPDYDDALKAKSIVLREMGHPEQAIEYHDRIIQLHPDDATAWSDKGATLYAAGRTNEALACFARALQLDPNNWMAQANMHTLMHHDPLDGPLDVTRDGT
jgi:tetratricopeptide (TPR) repeat protein